jgi:hypothetical protein
VVNEEEAERVRAIFALFEEYGSARLTPAEIERRGWRLKSWTRKTGKFRSGGLFTLSALRRQLTNILYTGGVRHQGHIYAGEHAAILLPDQWERVQSLIAQPALARGGFPASRTCGGGGIALELMLMEVSGAFRPFLGAARAAQRPAPAMRSASGRALGTGMLLLPMRSRPG